MHRTSNFHWDEPPNDSPPSAPCGCSSSSCARPGSPNGAGSRTPPATVDCYTLEISPETMGAYGGIATQKGTTLLLKWQWRSNSTAHFKRFGGWHHTSTCPKSWADLQKSDLPRPKDRPPSSRYCHLQGFELPRPAQRHRSWSSGRSSGRPPWPPRPRRRCPGGTWPWCSRTSPRRPPEMEVPQRVLLGFGGWLPTPDVCCFMRTPRN